MPLHNADIAAAFDEIADLLDLEEANPFRVLEGVEVDILEDGELDLPDEVLARLDVVVGAVHSHFDLGRDRQTARILRAMDHPFFDILAHPTGRLIDRREPFPRAIPRVQPKTTGRSRLSSQVCQPRKKKCRGRKDLGRWAL